MIPRQNYENQKFHKIQCQRNENHENLIVYIQNNENREITKIQRQNNENHEHLIIPRQNY